MDAVYGWVKNIICCLCLLEMLYHIIQNAEYQKYLRFFGGIIFMLLTVGPLLDFFDLQASFGEALRFSLRQEDARNLQEAAESLAELQNERIDEAYQSELKRQIEAIVKGHDRYPVQTYVTLREEDGIRRILKVEIQITGERDKRSMGTEGAEDEIEAIRSEISAVYDVGKENISITVKG